MQLDSLTLRGIEARAVVLPLKRPVVAVLDTGLTGCILSDSLYKELRTRFQDSELLQGATISLPLSGDGKQTIDLTSSDQYWRYSSFKLPWFDDEDRHPHIIALGSTFWTNVESLVVDVDSQRAKIVPLRA